MSGTRRDDDYYLPTYLLAYFTYLPTLSMNYERIERRTRMHEARSFLFFSCFILLMVLSIGLKLFMFFWSGLLVWLGLLFASGN